MDSSGRSQRSVFVHRRRTFIGGSDVRIIMEEDEAALLRLWRENRGEAEPEDLSGDLLIQLGSVTEQLNRRCYEKNAEQVGHDWACRPILSAFAYLACEAARPALHHSRQ